ncbi:MAG: hypothetical protein ACYC0H_19925 [Solirubrobacteraceae bacterium]
MTIIQLDVLRAIDQRAQRNYPCSTRHEVADELGVIDDYDVDIELQRAARESLVEQVGTDREEAPCYALTDRGHERLSAAPE